MMLLRRLQRVLRQIAEGLAPFPQPQERAFRAHTARSHASRAMLGGFLALALTAFLLGMELSLGMVDPVLFPWLLDTPILVLRIVPVVASLVLAGLVSHERIWLAQAKHNFAFPMLCLWTVTICMGGIDTFIRPRHLSFFIVGVTPMLPTFLFGLRPRHTMALGVYNVTAACVPLVNAQHWPDAGWAERLITPINAAAPSIFWAGSSLVYWYLLRRRYVEMTEASRRAEMSQRLLNCMAPHAILAEHRQGLQEVHDQQQQQQLEAEASVRARHEEDTSSTSKMAAHLAGNSVLVDTAKGRVARPSTSQAPSQLHSARAVVAGMTDPRVEYLAKRAGPKRYESVFIVTMDICNFTNMSRTITAEALVSMLDAVFLQVDRAAAAEGMEKIKTVGDAYIAARGLFDQDDGDFTEADAEARAREAARAVCRFALKVSDTISRYTVNAKPLRCRVGVAKGPVIAGMLPGVYKNTFDCFGETANYSALLEAGAPPGQVLIDDATRHALREDKIADGERSYLQTAPSGLRFKGKKETFLVTKEVLSETGQVIALIGGPPQKGELHQHLDSSEQQQQQLLETSGDRDSSVQGGSGVGVGDGGGGAPQRVKSVATLSTGAAGTVTTGRRVRVRSRATASRRGASSIGATSADGRALLPGEQLVVGGTTKFDDDRALGVVRNDSGMTTSVTSGTLTHESDMMDATISHLQADPTYEAMIWGADKPTATASATATDDDSTSPSTILHLPVAETVNAFHWTADVLADYAQETMTKDAALVRAVILMYAVLATSLTFPVFTLFEQVNVWLWLAGVLGCFWLPIVAVIWPMTRWLAYLNPLTGYLVAYWNMILLEGTFFQTLWVTYNLLICAVAVVLPDPHFKRRMAVCIVRVLATAPLILLAYFFYLTPRLDDTEALILVLCLLVMLPPFGIVLCLLIYADDMNTRFGYVLRRKIEQETEQNLSMLARIVPMSMSELILGELLDREHNKTRKAMARLGMDDEDGADSVAVAHSHPSSTVCFLQIRHVEDMALPEIDRLEIAAEAFAVLDVLCLQEGCVPMKQIYGTTYLAVHGVSPGHVNSQHVNAVAMTHFALRALNALVMWQQQARSRSAEVDKLSFSAGINEGPLVSGVIGGDKFQFDIWGATVNLAQRMMWAADDLGMEMPLRVGDLLQGRPEFTVSKPRLRSIKGAGMVQTVRVTSVPLQQLLESNNLHPVKPDASSSSAPARDLQQDISELDEMIAMEQQKETKGNNIDSGGGDAEVVNLQEPSPVAETQSMSEEGDIVTRQTTVGTLITEESQEFPHD